MELDNLDADDSPTRKGSYYSGCLCCKKRKGLSLAQRREKAIGRWKRVATLRYVLSGLRHEADNHEKQQYKGRELDKGESVMQEERALVLYPWSPARKVLDVMSSVIVLYFCFATPFRAGFLSRESDPITYELVFDAVLLLDIISTFFTAFIHNFEIVHSFRLIALRYFQRTFLFDLVSVIPFYIIRGDLMWLKIFRLLHINRITDLLIGSQQSLHKSCLDRIDWHTRRHIRNIVRLMLYLCLACHIIACVWYYIAVTEEEVMEKTWTGDVPSNLSQAYVAALYWTIVTLATVGYGDVTAKTNPEFAYSMAVELLGILIFALLVGNITSIVSNMNMCDAIFTQQENDLDKWLEALERSRPNKRLSNELYLAIRNSLTYRWKKDHSALIMHSDYFFRLPERLRIALGKTFFTDEVEKFEVFMKDTEIHFQYRVVAHMFPRRFAADCTVLEAGISSDEFYFIDSGDVRLVCRGIPVLKLPTRSYFGEDYLLFNEAPPASLV